MAYMNHINNLYDHKHGQDILLFKEAWAMEKVDGSGAKLCLKRNEETHGNIEIQYHSGGASHEMFIKLFNEENLKKVFNEVALSDNTEFDIYGESAGGKIQKMSQTYGPNLFFIAYGVFVNNKHWLNLPEAEKLCGKFGLEFVPYTRVTTDIESLDKAKLAFSQLAIRKGMGDNKIMEGVVLLPIVEMTKNNGQRIISKHKRDEFRESASPKKVIDPDKIKLIEDAEQIANEYVVLERLKHVLSNIPDHSIEKTGDIIKAMIADVEREGEFECVITDQARKAIGKKTAVIYKEYLKSLIVQ